MKFSNGELEREYYRIKSENPDIDQISHPFINFSDTLKAYFALADYFTDPTSTSKESMLIGVRSTDLVYSAINRQVVSFGGKQKYSHPIDICSTLFFGMVKNHSFSDGNKRTALLVLLYQLDLFNYIPNAPIKSFEKLVIATAANELPDQYNQYWKKYRKEPDAEVKTIAHFLRKNTKKKDHSYHLKITMQDMANALSNYGVQSTLSNGKIHFTRKVSVWLGFGAKELNYSIVFGGWTRCLGAATAREILQKLDLYRQIPDYQSFVNGTDLFYSLIQDFEVPLRRLKDE